MTVRIVWTFSVDEHRVAELLPDGWDDPAEVVDALLDAAERNAGTTLGARFHCLADELGDALDRLPRRRLGPCERAAAREALPPELRSPVIPEQRQPVTCPVCGSTRVDPDLPAG